MTRSRDPFELARARPRQRQPESYRSLGDDPLARTYDAGPFAALPVESPPAELFALLHPLTGRVWTEEEVAAFVRVAAFLGYDGGVETTSVLEAHRWDPEAPAPEKAAQDDRAPTPRAIDVLGFDPLDLGDE